MRHPGPSPPSPGRARSPLSVPAATITSILNQTLVPVPTDFQSVTTTLNVVASPLPSSCFTPYFASIVDPAGNIVVYAQFGCSYWNQDCCPYGWNEGVVLDECIGNYTTQVLGTHSACCPMRENGVFTLFSSAIGITPCASKLTGTVYMPDITPTERNININTQVLFAYSLPLATRRAHSPVRIVVPIVVVILLLVAIGAAVLIWKSKQRGGVESSTLALKPSAPARPSSIDGPDQSSPLTTRNLSPVPASSEPPALEASLATPPAYVDTRPKAVELPGGNHHPAFDPELSSPDFTSHSYESIGRALSTSNVPLEGRAYCRHLLTFVEPTKEVISR